MLAIGRADMFAVPFVTGRAGKKTHCQRPHRSVHRFLAMILGQSMSAFWGLLGLLNEAPLSLESRLCVQTCFVIPRPWNPALVRHRPQAAHSLLTAHADGCYVKFPTLLPKNGLVLIKYGRKNATGVSKAGHGRDVCKVIKKRSIGRVSGKLFCS